MSLHNRLKALERKHPAGVVIVLDEADRAEGDERAWFETATPGVAFGYARRGETAEAWAARVGFDPGRRPFARIMHLKG